MPLKREYEYHIFIFNLIHCMITVYIIGIHIVTNTCFYNELMLQRLQKNLV